LQKMRLVTAVPAPKLEKEERRMKQVRSTWTKKARITAVAFIVFFASHLLFAQSGATMQMKIPYSFTFAGTQLPAGSYAFSMDKTRLAVQSATGDRFVSIVITEMSGPGILVRDGSLVFDKTGGNRILSEVWMPNSKGFLLHSVLKNHKRDILMGSTLSPTGTVSGKEAFARTCAKCHGEDGKGNKSANKFFNTTIPNLTSAEVQSKSDDQLRRQISRGGDKMPPVEIDEAGFRHLLPPQDVNAVIAYVRNLKQ
jgi:mono/diheme cytochrome c family protein